MAGFRSIQLFLVLPLFALSVDALCGLLAPGTTGYCLASCVLFLLVAWLWTSSSKRFAAFCCAASILLAATFAVWSSLHSLPGQRVGLVVRHAVGAPTALEIFVTVALTGVLAAAAGRPLFRYLQPWPAVALAAAGVLLRADVSLVYADRFPAVLILGLILVVVTRAGSIPSLASTVALTVGLITIIAAWQLPVSLKAWSQSLSDPLATLAHREASGRPASSILSMTGSFHPSNQVVMTVKTTGSNIRPYWRQIVFDRYDGHTWQVSSGLTRTVHAASTTANIDTNHAPAIVSAQVITDEPSQYLVSPGPPSSANIKTRAFYSPSGLEVLSLQPSGELPAGATYRIAAALPPSGLSADGRAGSSYLAPYLQLPSLQPRVRNLARAIAGSATNDLAVSLRLEGYLHNNRRFHYDAREGSPVDRDAVTDFLFRTHRGYCNQFASSMVILARELGIPARLVSGYSTGTYRAGVYTVRERDAHSWAELYIDGDGWIPFEPTPGFALDPSLTASRSGTMQGVHTSINHRRPVSRFGKVHRSQPNPFVATAAPHRRQSPSPRPIPRTPIAAALVLLIGLLSLPIAALLRRPRTVRDIYHRTVRLKGLPGGGIRAHETPLEFSQRFCTDEQMNRDVRLIVQMYIRERYGAGLPTSEDVRSAYASWGRLRRRYWWTRSALF